MLFTHCILGTYSLRVHQESGVQFNFAGIGRELYPFDLRPMVRMFLLAQDESLENPRSIPQVYDGELRSRL